VRQSRDSEIEGPFTIDQINQMLRQKRLTFKSLALEDKGQGLENIKQTTIKLWMMVSDIPGYVPDPDVERNCLLTALAIAIVVGIIVILGLIKLADILHRIH
jgi:hypothetical protein